MAHHHTSPSEAGDSQQAEEARRMWIKFTEAMKYSTIAVLVIVALLAIFFV